MKTELLGQEKNVVRIKVDFEADEFLKSVQELLDKLSQQANIPGFRKGHAPRRVLEMRFGRKAILSDAFDDLINANVQQIAEDYELDLLDNPRLEPCEPVEGEPVSCVLSFEVMPEVELPDIEAMEVEKLKVSITEEMLDRGVRMLRKRFSEVRDVDRPVGPEDLVRCSLVAQVGDEAPREPETESLDLFEETTRREIRDALVGHSKGETVEVTFDVEPNHPSIEYAGKKVHYALTIEGVSEFVLPELNEAFYHRVFGEDTDVHSEEDLRNRIRKDLAENLEQESRDDAERRALDRISQEAKLDVPMILIRRQAAALRRADEREAEGRYKATLKDVLGQNDENWEKAYVNILMMRARAMVRQSLIVDAIAKKYGIQVGKDEVEAEVERRAKIYGIDANVLRGMYYKNEDSLAALTGDIQFSLATDLLLEKMRVKEVDELTPPEPQEKPEGDTPAGAQGEGEGE